MVSFQPYCSASTSFVAKRNFQIDVAFERDLGRDVHFPNLAPDIRVNLVSPGWVRTPMAEATFAIRGKLEAIVSAVPLRRVAEPEDIASAVLFLADDRQRHLTGVDLAVSGGALLPMPRG